MIRWALLVLLLSSANSLATDVTVEGPPDLEQHYRDTVGRLVREVEQALGFSYRGEVRVRLARTEDEFRRWAGKRPEWVAAVGIPRAATLVVRLSSVGPERGLAINSVLRHELVHVMLPERLGWKTRVPLWFEEGLAQVVGGRINRSDLDRLPLVAAAGNLIPLRELADRFPTDRERAALAYAQGESVLHFLITRYGYDQIATLLSATARERSFEAALDAEFGLDSEELEAKWQDWLRNETSWWDLLTRAFLPLLFFISSLLAIVAWALARGKRRETYEALGE